VIGEPAQALSIGSVVGGATPANQPWRDGIRGLTNRVVAARAGTESPLNVNVVFQIPGHVISPDFTGTRTGRFSKQDGLLMVQVALPEEVPEDPEGYLLDALHGAVNQAEEWARKRRLTADLAELRAILARV
jgi:hypothetical protein